MRSAKMIPHIVKIETQGGYGTGFLSLKVSRRENPLWSRNKARHVVIHADEWQQPIRIRHHSSGETVFLKANEWTISL